MSSPANTAVEGPTLDEADHDALDLLDALECGQLWLECAAERSSEAEEQLERALEQAGEDRSAAREAAVRARAVFATELRTNATRLLDAAARLSESAEAAGDLDPETIEGVRALLETRPELAPALAAAVEITALILGLERGSVAWAELLLLADRAEAEAPADVARLSEAIGERLAAARAVDAGPPVPTPLRVFRSATFARAGVAVRARALASDHPEQLALARALVEEGRHEDPAALVAAFDEARAQLARAQAEAEAGAATPAPDGPRRSFTWVHAVLALIILALTIWHYVLR